MKRKQIYILINMQKHYCIISGRYGDLIKQYEVSLSQMLNAILRPDHRQ